MPVALCVYGNNNWLMVSLWFNSQLLYYSMFAVHLVDENITDSKSESVVVIVCAIPDI